VPVETTEAGEELRLEYQAPLGRSVVAIRVVSNVPVDVYVLPEDGLKEFDDKDARTFAYYRSSEGRQEHDIRFATVQREHWYLVIVNDSSRPAHVFYEVKW